MNMKYISLALAAALAVGCGGDDEGPTGPTAPTAAEFAGTWIFQSITEEGVTWTRDGSPEAVRADMVITPTGAATADLYVRLLELSDGLIDGRDDEELLVAVEVGKLFIQDPDNADEDLVYRFTRAGETLTLTADLADPRHEVPADETATEIVLERVTPWGTQCVGTWETIQITFPGEAPLTSNTCFEASPGVWGTFSSDLEINDHLEYERVDVFTAYADNTCSTGATPITFQTTGIAEEEGSTFRLWAETDAGGTWEPTYGEHTIAVDASGEMTLTRVVCLPAGCESTVPTEVVYRPR